MPRKTTPNEVKAPVPVAEVVKVVAAEEIVKEIIPTAPVEAPMGILTEKEFDKEAWRPKTALGQKVKSGEITNLDQIIDAGFPVLEASIVDALVHNLESDLLAIGQSKGKFGGGKKSIWRQVQKKTAEGNKPSFAALVIVGNKNGYIGLGYGKARETLPAREKAVRKAKLNMIKVRRGCGSWECGCGGNHSIPCKIIAKCGSVVVEILPAPKGTGLAMEKEAAKILALAGIKDVYSRTYGQTRTKLNHLKAIFEALRLLAQVKIKPAMNKAVAKEQ